ncbi:hypothetical protein [Salinimicrobium soli]|uniref:hypothetical protein n=1 Tax=Salinimicrobium soli TaxID=1254399 RepID=UPI003AAB010D
MKERLLTGWSWVRFIYLLMGLLVLAQAISETQWWGVGVGAYVFLMGLFGFGCAVGNCAGGSCEAKPDRDQKI